MELHVQQHLQIVLLGSKEHPGERGSKVVIPHPSETCSLLRLSYKCVVVTWILSSPCNVPDVFVKKLDGVVHDRIRPMSRKGWEVGRVFPSLNLVFGFLSRSGFLVVCTGTPLLTVAFAVFYFGKIDYFIPSWKKKKKKGRGAYSVSHLALLKMCVSGFYDVHNQQGGRDWE